MLECVVLLEEEWERGTWKGGEGGMTEGGREGGREGSCVCVCTCTCGYLLVEAMCDICVCVCVCVCVWCCAHALCCAALMKLWRLRRQKVCVVREHIL